MTLIIDESLTAKGFTPAALAPDRLIEFIGIHHWGSLGQKHDDVNDFFVNGPGATSAHFVASAGRANCLVSPRDVSWAMGTWAANLRAITIELRPEATDADYQTAAELIAWIRATYGENLPLRPHREFVATACPGVWDLARLDRMAREIAAGGPAAPIVPATAAELAPNPAPEAGADQCIVVPGDTLSGIAQQFGVSLADLIAVNGITEPDLIFPGMILDLPAAAPAAPAGLPPYCTVEPGDTLSGIAQQFGVSLGYIISRNPGIDQDLIFPGQRIEL